jgi:hypothetical protein
MMVAFISTSNYSPNFVFREISGPTTLVIQASLSKVLFIDTEMLIKGVPSNFLPEDLLTIHGQIHNI